MSTIAEIVFECAGPAALARFWAAALDGYRVRAYDSTEIARLALRGLTPETDPTVLVDGPGPSLCFQRVDGREYTNNRVHLDIDSTDVAAKVALLCGIGASVQRKADGYTVMCDPEGNQFCIVASAAHPEPDPDDPPIEIVPYKPVWTRQFEEIARTLRAGLGDLALRIDHIGSTSVPGLCAKDVVDIQVSVASLDDRVTSAMQTLGYQRVQEISRDHRPPFETGPEQDWQKLFFMAPLGQRRTNTHVRVLDRPNQRYALLFRDYLIAHPATAEAYGELKRRLARALTRRIDYPDVKDPAVDLIYLPAKRWAQETGWRLGSR